MLAQVQAFDLFGFADAKPEGGLEGHEEDHGEDEGEGEAGESAGGLDAEVAEVAFEDSAEGHGERAVNAADAVDRDGPHGVVDLELVEEEHREVNQHAGDESTDDQGADPAGHVGAGGDADQPGEASEYDACGGFRKYKSLFARGDNKYEYEPAWFGSS